MMERLRESRWVYILLSVVLALVFLLYVRADQDPPDSQWFNVPVELTGTSVLTRQGLTVSGLSSDMVSLRIEASSSVIDNLIRNREDISVTVDVSKCVEGENKLTYTNINYPLSVNVENVVVADRKPETITVTVDKLYTSSFAVEFQFKGKVADGYAAGTPAISPETVVVSGSVDQVSQVAKVAAILEEENLDERFAGDLPLVLLNAEGEVLTDLEVTLDFETAYVVLPVVVVKEIPLTVNILAGGGASEDDCTYEISPKTIIVSGAEEDIQDLTEISLGSVDLSQVVGSNTFTFPISLDSSLENVSGVTSAAVSVTVSGLATRTFDVDNIVLSKVPSMYSAELATQVRTVTVRGREEDLDAIDASQLRIVADMSEITTVGTYPVPVKVYLDANGSVGVIGEYSISVIVSFR